MPGIAVGTDMDAFRRKARLLLKPHENHIAVLEGKAERTFVRLAHGLDHSIDAEAVLREAFPRRAAAIKEPGCSGREAGGGRGLGTVITIPCGKTGLMVLGPGG